MERFRLSATRSRWLEFLGFEHPVLPAPINFGRDGDELLVRRAPVPRRRIRDGRIPDARAPELFLQAASYVATLESLGFWASADDLLEAAWDVSAGKARLLADRSPAGVAGGPRVRASDALGPFLDRISRRSGRIREPGARTVAAALAADGASSRRADFWVGAAYAAWSSLGTAEAAPARLRTLAFPGVALRSASDRLGIEQGRAVLEGRPARVFAPANICLAPGEAAGLSGADLESVIRHLREGLASSEGAGRRPVWICANENRWDALSRAALAAVALNGEISVSGSDMPEIVWIPESLPRPVRADEWRAEIFASCGTVRASLRFHERVASLAAAGSLGGRESAERLVAHPGWAAFVADPTGDAPLPPVLPDAPAALRAGRAARKRREDVPPAGRAGELRQALEASDREAALTAASAWRQEEGESPVEKWFELSARLAALVRPPRPPWLDALEAERELAGGRLAAAEASLGRILEGSKADAAERRAARLRLAEIAVSRGRARDAAEAASRWRADHPDAPADERVRGLLIEAAGAAREGDAGDATSLLDEARREAEPLDASVRVRVFLTRADAMARAGRAAEETACYEEARELLRSSPDESLAARVLAREALSLADRREFDGAIARLEEARRIFRDEPIESARLAIDLASTLYHAGRGERCEGLLVEAAALAVAAGREDLARIARGNLVEAALATEDWRGAAAGIDALLAGARHEGDETWILVALHHRARLALRQGRLGEAERDNAEARILAGRVGDRLEIGELWLEEGDRLALGGDAAGAAAAYRQAADDPPDRCDTSRRALDRIAELEAWEKGEREASSLLDAVRPALQRGEFASAEAVARWTGIAPERVPVDLRKIAASLLERRGAPALAGMCRPPSESGSAPWDTAGLRSLRALREAIAGALAGEEAPDPLPLGLAGIALANESGETVLSLGAAPPEGAPSRPLDAGAVLWTLRLFPTLPEETAEAVALVLESLLYRLAPAESLPDPAEGWRRFGVVAGDQAMEEPYRRLLRFAPKPMTVLVLGESGSGKEAVARAVHALSPRGRGSFVAVNVSAIPAALVESELFGHARGAFTGADRDRPGLLEEASGGTIFFDEIGDLATSLQSKLLRALQDREIRRVGENRTRHIDVRVVSATSRDLGKEVEEGRFREDLFYRLHVAVIRLPSLRERGRDAILLARHFLSQAAREDGKGAFEIEPDAVAAILAHTWPGNVRELQSAIASAAALADGRRIGAALLPEAVRRSARPADASRGYRSRVDAHRRDLIMEALDRAGGNRSRAARDLRLSRQALLYLIRELGVREKGKVERMITPRNRRTGRDAAP